jgi:ABC-type lipoprotein release transport system permease subunit
MRVSSRVRRHVWSTIGIALAIAVVTAIVLAVAGGARRTASAPDRYTASVGGDVDALVEQREGLPQTDAIAALPAVEELSAYTFLFGGFDDERIPESFITFAGTRPLSSRVVEGRDLDPSNPHEFVADSAFTDATGARVGDRFPFRSISRKTIESGKGFGGEPDGAAFDATLVGVLDSPDSINSDFTVGIFPAALLREDIGFAAGVIQVRLQPGASTEDLRDELDTLPNRETLSLEPGEIVGSEIRHAVDAQATGLWLLAVVLAVAALVALGQLLTRHVQRADHERTPLLAVGFTRRQRVVESLLVAAVPACIGIALGAALAILPSGEFPTGFARRLEPNGGVSVDFVALVFGSVVLLGAVLLWVVVAVTYDEHARTRPAPTRRTRALLARIPGTASAIGARFALTRGDRRRPAYGTIAGLAAVVALVVGAGVFAASLDRLLTDGARFGRNYTLALGDDGSEHSPDELSATFAKESDIAGLMILSEGSARVLGTTENLELIGFETVKGDLAPRAFAGRLPETADEIALGRVSAAELDLGVGDEVRLRGERGEAELHVVGLAIVPGVGGNDGVGLGGVVPTGAFQRVNGESSTNVAAITVRADAAPGTARRIAARFGVPPDQQATPQDLPPAISNVERVRRVPTALAALLGVLVLLTLLHVLFMSIRSRRVDVAILKGLGANRRWISRVVHSQATLLAAVPLVIGLPLGLLAGTRVYRSFVDRIGALPDPTVPAAAIIAFALGLLVLANLAALLPARRARRLPTATLLRAE